MAASIRRVWAKEENRRVTGSRYLVGKTDKPGMLLVAILNKSILRIDRLHFVCVLPGFSMLPASGTMTVVLLQPDAP